MRFRQPGVLCSVDLATTPTLDQHPKVPADFWVESNSSSAPRRYRVSGTRSRLIRPSVRQCSLEHRLDSLGCFRYRAPSHRDPPGRSLEPRHFPTGGFIPRDQSAPTHPGWHLGSLLSRGLSPPCSATRLVAERSLLAVGVCATHLVSQAAMVPILDFEVFFRSGDAGFRSWCYPLWSSLPSSGFVLLWDPNLPLGTGRPKSPTPSAHGVGSQDLDLTEVKPSLWSPRLQRFTGEKVWRPSPGLAIPLEVSSL
jgi:hypothetical protein